MITSIRSLVVQPGKAFEYRTVAKELAGIMKRASGHEPIIAMSFGGDPLAFAFIGTYANVAELDDAHAKLFADAAYRTAITKTDHLVVPGSFRDQFWRHI
jgi:hypothetical protein